MEKITRHTGILKVKNNYQQLSLNESVPSRFERSGQISATPNILIFLRSQFPFLSPSDPRPMEIFALFIKHPILSCNFPWIQARPFPPNRNASIKWRFWNWTFDDVLFSNLYRYFTIFLSVILFFTLLLFRLFFWLACLHQNSEWK